MLCIFNNSVNPYFNIACEDYLFNELKEDCFMLYRNENAIIVGKHQNTLAEINYKYVKENNIKVVRRLSGGGTVYHDLGNLNFTFIQKNQSPNLVDFKRHLKPIVDVLAKMGLSVEIGKKNDLIIDGKKISGNAEHVYKDKVLHHGTLLFSSDLIKLSQAIKVTPNKYEDKAVKSIRSKVVNIKEFLLVPMDILRFAQLVMEHILANHPENRLYQLSDDDIQRIQAIADAKYANWEWNYAYSPPYRFYNQQIVEKDNYEIEMNIDNGLIKKIKLSASNINKEVITEIENILEECKHKEQAIRTRLEKNKMNNNLIDAIISIMF